MARSYSRRTRTPVRSLDENRHHWRSFDGEGCRTGELTFPFSELRAVHDIDGRVRIILHDGSARGMPRGVRKLLAQRIAERLPRPDEIPALADPGT